LKKAAQEVKTAFYLQCYSAQLRYIISGSETLFTNWHFSSHHLLLRF